MLPSNLRFFNKILGSPPIFSARRANWGNAVAILILLCSVAFAQIPGENNLGTFLIAMPTYTYTRTPGTLGLQADEETWSPEKWKNRRIFNRFAPIMDWKIQENSVYFYTGNEIGDMLWQELNERGEEPNRTPMLLGGFATPLYKGFYAAAEFNQIDHFSTSTFAARKIRNHGSDDFSWFGGNLPAYSGLSGELGFIGSGKFFKKASVTTGSEYVWAWHNEEWVPIRISPRVQGDAVFNVMDTEVELLAGTEKFEILDSAAQYNNSLGFRLKRENIGGGFYAYGEKEKIGWTDFNFDFFGNFSNRGFVAVNQDKEILFADSLEYAIKIKNSTTLTPGFLINQNGIKLYEEATYKIKHLYAKTKTYQNYTEDFTSVGFDGEVAYKSNSANIGVLYSREFFDEERDYGLAQNSAKMFLKYRFLKDLFISHEWIYRDFPKTWLWNAQIEQRIPQLNASLYAVWIEVLQGKAKNFDFGGYNETRFYCGIRVLL